MKRYPLTLLFLIMTFTVYGQINLATDGSKASASAEHPNGLASYAFDNNTSTGWYIDTSPEQWIQYDFETPVVINGYAMHYLADSSLEYQPTDWILSGSNNETDWTAIDTVAGDQIAFIWEEFITSNTNAYRYYRFNISASGNDTLAVGELRMYQITVPSVVTGEANYVEAQLAVCSGNVTQSGGSPITQRGICYNTTGNPTLGDSYQYSSAGTGSFNLILPNLTPNTTYYFRAFASNSEGTCYADEVKTFTTLKLSQTITFPDLPVKIYGDIDFEAGASSSSGLEIVYSSSNPAIAAANGSQIQINGAGSTVITASQPGNSTYLPAEPVNKTLTVHKKQLAASADNKERQYGADNPVFTISYSGFVNEDNVSVLDSAPTASSVADENSNVGTYFITLAGGFDNNYTYSYTPGILTVTKAPLQATAENTERQYGQPNPEFTIAYSGFLNDDDISDIDFLPTATSSADETTHTGLYTIIVSGGNDNNYAFGYCYGVLSIKKASLTVIADNKEKAYGDANPVFTLSYLGLMNEDNDGDIDSPPTASSPADESSYTGTYPILLSEGSDNNYVLTCVNGTLTVNKATLSVTASDSSRYVGEPNPVFTIEYYGFKNDDSAEDIDELPVTECMADASSAAGLYVIEVKGGNDTNYDFEYSNGTLTILELVNALSPIPGNTLYIYPNPASNSLYYSGCLPDNASLTITDLNGRILYNNIPVLKQTDVSGIAPGIYYMQITDEKEIIHQQIIVISR